VDFEETTLLITEPQFNLPSIKEAMDEILFEEYNFSALSRSSAPQLSAYKCHQDETDKHLVCLVIDCGYSFTHIIPVFNGKVIKKAVRSVVEFTRPKIAWVLQLKEDTCFVSNQLYKDMDTCRLKGPNNNLMRDYVLPDYSHIKRGYVKILRMNIERFSVPELLFHPSDIGIQEMGIAEAVINSIQTIPKGGVYYSRPFPTKLKESAVAMTAELFAETPGGHRSSPDRAFHDPQQPPNIGDEWKTTAGPPTAASGQARSRTGGPEAFS
ncbi:hypothetical protein QZH41_002569, partial [Actinostola sp. cb2023]